MNAAINPAATKRRASISCLIITIVGSLGYVLLLGLSFSKILTQPVDSRPAHCFFVLDSIKLSLELLASAVFSQRLMQMASHFN